MPDRGPRYRFVLGLDLDGACADLSERERVVASEWTGRANDDDAEPLWGLDQWRATDDDDLSGPAYAGAQRSAFVSLPPRRGAPGAIHRLAAEGVRIRIITHRFADNQHHEFAVAQTVRWLDRHEIPYWDLCFLRERGDVGADLYVDAVPETVSELRAAGRSVVVLTEARNAELPDEPGGRAADWAEAERVIRDRYGAWLDAHGLARPRGPGLAPDWVREPRRG